MMKKTIVFGVLFVGAILFFVPEPEFSFSQVAPISSKKWDVRPLSAEKDKIIESALAQKFTYGASGAQAYVFFSDDGKTVLKLFKKKRFQAPLWVRSLPPLPYKMKKMQAKRDNLIKDFTSYQLAYNKLQNETGLLLVHLDNTPLHYETTLVDSQNKAHRIHLSDYAFILQKRGELVYSALERSVKEQKLEAAKESLSSLVHLLRERCEKGVADRDPNFSKNYAFLGTEAIEIDIGRFSRESIHPPKIPRDFKQWLEKLSPELLTHFEQEYEVVFSKPLSSHAQPS